MLLPREYENDSCFPALPIVDVSSLSSFKHSNGCTVVSHSEHFFMSLLAICKLPLVKNLFMSFVRVFDYVLCLFIIQL